MSKLRTIINEVLIEESWLKGMLSGGVAGFITSWVFTHKSKNNSKSETSRLVNAAVNFQDSIQDLKSALQPFAGNTTDEKWESFLTKLQNTSFDDLPRSKRKRKKL